MRSPVRVKHGRSGRAHFVFLLVVLAAKKNVRHRLGILLLRLHERDGTATTNDGLLRFQRREFRLGLLPALVLRNKEVIAHGLVCCLSIRFDLCHFLFGFGFGFLRFDFGLFRLCRVVPLPGEFSAVSRVR